MSKKLNIFISHPSDMLTDCLPHGDGLMADRIIRYLSERDHNLHVAVAGHEIERPYRSNVTLHLLQDRPLPGNIHSRISFALRTRSRFRSLSKKIPFDLIHQLNPVVTGLCVGLVGLDCPLVMGPYVPEWPESQRVAAYPFRLANKLQDMVKRAIWMQQHRMADGIILSTPAALGKVSNIKAVKDKIHYIPYGVDTKLFTPGFPANNSTILFLAQISEHKGIYVLLDAFKKVSAAIPTCRLVLAGGGNDLPAVKQFVSRNELSRKVDLAGVIDRDQIPDLMRQSSLFVLPSFGEPFGVSALEAMACGLPVVVTEAGGLPYFVSDKGGRKVPVGDPDKLAQAIIEILSNQDLANAMGAYNRLQIEEYCSWTRVIERIEAVYDGVIQHGSHSGTNHKSENRRLDMKSWFKDNFASMQHPPDLKSVTKCPTMSLSKR